MNLVVDLIVLMIVVICAIWGARRGFVLAFFNFFGGVASFIVASIFAKPVGLFFSDSIIKPICCEYLTDAFKNYLSEQMSALNGSESVSSAIAFFSKFGFRDEEVQPLFPTEAEFSDHLIQSAVDSLVTPIARSVGFALAMLLIFIVVFLILKLLSRVLDLISKLPVLNLSNRVFGTVFGTCFGLLLALAFSCVLVVVEPLLQSFDAKFFSDFSIDQTYVARFFVCILKL